MRLARLRDHSRAEIDADAIRGLQRGEQIAGAAAELEHAGALRDQKLQVEEVLVMKELRARKPVAAFRRARISQTAHLMPARQELL